MALEIEAIHFIQNETTMYIAKMKTTDLLNRTKVDVWRIDEGVEKGYQRNPSVSRARSFGRFMQVGNTSPSSILLSIRGDDAKRVRYEKGHLIVPDNLTLWLVDGQHRVEGLRQVIDVDSNIGGLEFPVVIMLVDLDYEEAKQFVIINKTQKGVRADLAERFLQKAIKMEGWKQLRAQKELGILKPILGDIDWRPRAVEIADMLNNDTDSVWHGKIRLPNAPKENTIVAQKSFTDSLEPILKHEYFKNRTADAIVSILNNYWNAISKLCDDAFDTPQDYVLQKTTGTFVLHRILPTVAKYCRDAQGKLVLTEPKIEEILSKVKKEYMNSKYWHVDGEAGQMGTSQKTFKLIADFIERSLADAVEKVEEFSGDIVY